MAILLTWEPNGTVAYFSDEVRFADYQAVHADYISDPRVHTVSYTIFVFQSGSHFNFEPMDLDRMASLEKETLTPLRKVLWAVVTHDPEITNTLSKIFFENPIYVCETLEQARGYIHTLLGLNNDTLNESQKIVKQLMHLDDPNPIVN